MDSRFVALLYLQACSTGKRTDGRPWRHIDFVHELRYVQHVVNGDVSAVDMGPGRPQQADLEKLAKAAGMQTGTLSAEEWGAIQQAERDRLSKITQ